MRGLVNPGVCLSLVLAACGELEVETPDGGTVERFDARGATPPPSTPLLEDVPPRMPYTVVTLRGQTNGRRVLVEGVGNPRSIQTIAGSFCIDVPVPAPGSYELQVYALGADGQLSDGAARVGVEIDPTSAPISGASTCSGADPAGCSGAEEICGNGRDDDCNNLADDRDPACAICAGDLLDDQSSSLEAPALTPGRYENLVLCPGDIDVYGVLMRAGETLNARIFFSDEAGNLELQLLAPDRRTVLARSLSVTDDESLTHTSSVAAEYKLVVFAEPGVTNDYTLSISVAP